VLKQTSIRLIDDDCFGQAKAVAYSFLLFFFPFLLFLVAALVLTHALSALAPQLIQLLSHVMPRSTRMLITEYVSGLAATEPTDVLVGAFGAMLWTGSGMMVSFIEGLDRAYRLPTQRSLVKQRLVAIGLVFLVGLPLVLLALLVIFSLSVEKLVGARLSITVPWFWRFAWWTFVLAATMLMIAIIYHVGPDRKQKWRNVLPGAGLATLLWILVTLGFSAYVSHFGEYDVIYGSLGAGIILLIWMYLTSLVVLIGGEFNAVVESNRGALDG
jgi:membrane protein